jgi:FMN phosphatase YigB (HAD superfamily)
LAILWCGIDYGETIMNPLTLHQSTVIREIYTELGRAEEAEGRVRRWYRLRDSMGPASVPTHQRVRDLKQYARDRIYREVFDDDRGAVERFDAKEVKGWASAEGLMHALSLLHSKRIPVAVVSESASVAAARAVARFLTAHALTLYFEEIITPAGRFSVDGRLLDAKFVGATKKSGKIYEELRGYLQSRRIPSSAAAMIGDDPLLDVEHAKRYGFVTIQYVGVIDRGGHGKADYMLTDWKDLGKII